MERRPLTKEDIDKVRDVEGFPIATDDAIIELSDAPYYTACPNPFIKDFIDEYGTPYDEETDDYHREPFTADVSEGKNDPIYNAHSYHTKVPYKAIMRYILHYTKPGDIVFDGFCGTGMTGVAAQMCGCPDQQFKQLVQSDMSGITWGRRRAVLNDLSPAATFIAHNYNSAIDETTYEKESEELLAHCEAECGWMYKTAHTGDSSAHLDLGQAPQGTINYTVWSEVLVCPHCSQENVFWDIAADLGQGKIKKEYRCQYCGTKLLKRECPRAMETHYDAILSKPVTMVKFVPVLVNYSYGGHRYEKKPDASDLALIDKISAMESPYRIPKFYIRPGEKTDDPERLGITYVHQMYSKRNALFLGCAFHYAESDAMKFVITSAMTRMAKMNKFTMDRKMGIFTGTLNIPSLHIESYPYNTLSRKVKDIRKAIYDAHDDDVCIQCGSLSDMRELEDNSIDYIFTDPPFGGNLIYSDLSLLWEAWLGVVTNNEPEAIITTVQQKTITEYQQLMEECLAECCRVLKPNRWITIEFHNSQNKVWNAIQEAILKAGFVVADVRTLNKQQGSYNQVRGALQAIKQDLVITAYKPKDSFKQKLVAASGTDETAWSFVQQHLGNLPIVTVKDGQLEVIAERQAYLLFDRMVAYHVTQGIPVPLDATDFYRGLDERFIKRDDMYFLPDQVTEYDTARLKMDVEQVQTALLVTNEKAAIGWLYALLGGKPLTYQEIQPKFMQAVKTVDRYEDMPELAVLLEENFLQDDKGRWYVPDTKKEGDVAKLREKSLLREFDGYLKTKGKLKLFRSEAVRAGFSKLWKDKNYQGIVDLAERLPEQTIQEDPNLLMYYDISLSRVGQA